MVRCYILSQKLLLKSQSKRLSDARVASITTKVVFQYIFYKDSSSLSSQYLMDDQMKFVEVLVCLKFS